MKAAGVGLNLTAANNIFLVDPWWNPAVEEQAIDRVHRIGQTKDVNIFFFKGKKICRSTLSGFRWKAALRSACTRSVNRKKACSI